MRRLCTCLAAVVALTGPLRGQNATVLYTGDTRAFLESCGCQEAALGGIGQRGTLIERYRADGLPLLLVDAGGIGGGEEERDRERVETYLQAMVALEYDAVNLAGEDLGSGLESIRRIAARLPLLSTNLRAGDELGVPAYRVRQLGPWKVGLLGLGAPASSPPGAAFLPPPQALAGVLPGLRGTADVLVLLSGLSEPENLALAEQIPELDLIVARGPAPRRQVGRTTIVGTAAQGTHLGRLELAVGPDGRPVVERVDTVPIGADLPELAAVRSLLDGFYAAVSRQVGGAALAGPRATAADSSNPYLGAPACSPCHPREEAAWRGTAHALAFDTLLRKNRQFYPDCAPCHTTGYGRPGGFQIRSGDKPMAGVQCEACHGPGSRHASRPEAANIARTPDLAACQSCHTPSQTPDFAVRPGAYLAQVDHRPAAPRAPAAAPAQAGPRPASGRARLELFVMSLCPYAMEAERALVPWVDRFREAVDFEIRYIAEERGTPTDRPPLPAGHAARAGCAGAGSGNGPFTSLHGQAEIDEGRRQLIVRADDPDRYLRYLLCRARQGPEGDWQECARAVGLDPDALQAAALGPRGEELFRQNIRRANALGVNLSPTLLIDGVEFGGRLEGMPVARYLCRHGAGGSRCGEVPACGSDEDCQGPSGKVGLCLDPDTERARCEYRDPVPFSLSVLNTRACPTCATGEFLRTTIPLFPQVEVDTRDVETPEGEELARRYGIEVFPAYIFSAAFSRSPRFPRVQHLVQARGDHFVLQSRLSATTYWRRRPPLPGRLDVFLPAGDLLSEDQVVARWPAHTTAIHVRFLADPGRRLQPPPELERRACLAGRQPERYPAYASFRNQQLRTLGQPENGDEWLTAARQAGVDVDELERCTEDGTARTLLEAAAATADSLELDPAAVAALLGNQVLMRRAEPYRFMSRWLEAGTP